MTASVPPVTRVIPVDPSWKIGLVVSPYYGDIASALVASARKALMDAGIPEQNISEHLAYGSWEIPLIGAALAKEKKVDALVGMGVILEGQTHHAQLLADAMADGIMRVQLDHLIPFAFEVLYVDDLKLARARVDRGGEAARAVLSSLAEMRGLRSGPIEY